MFVHCLLCSYQRYAFARVSQYVDSVVISQKVIQGVYPGVTTVELVKFAAQTAASLLMQNHDFSILAACIKLSNLHKPTGKVFSKIIKIFYRYMHPKTGKPAPLVS